MSEDDGDAIAAIVDAIRHYFSRYPTAADSVDGIQRWWLPPPLDEEPLFLVELAIDRLVEEGVVRRFVLEDGGVIYRSNARQE